MLDFRHETFLAICSSSSFTKAAEMLHITQPAVSQHIKYLEDHYGCKLLDTSNRKISLTPEGEVLKDFATTVYSDSQHLKESFTRIKKEAVHFSFGATLSIGEYVMPTILSRLLVDCPDISFHMTVANTKSLLEQLNHGDLDFLLIEGLFDKTHYETSLFRRENFIPVCSPSAEYAYRTIPFESLRASRLILREEGSGTREIFEHILEDRNYSLKQFHQIIEIGNMSAIKEMVSNNLGITFLFEVAAQKEIKEGKLAKIDILDFAEEREFYFVTLKNSFFRDQYVEIFQRLKELSKE
ncbi:MAG: LysR family transcriptional regulator [Gallicola sp.]|nr:LysR family transcriptional regulator [Gallicola sp.]